MVYVIIFYQYSTTRVAVGPVSELMQHFWGLTTAAPLLSTLKAILCK